MGSKRLERTIEKTTGGKTLWLLSLVLGSSKDASSQSQRQ